jgi:patatin-like phospholipase/acyl hydrolase
LSAYSHFERIAFFIDGGGIRGLSGLAMLQEMMSRIEFDQGLDSTPQPRDYFNMIAGGGTGGYGIAFRYY